jgi:hypothetical protein
MDETDKTIDVVQYDVRQPDDLPSDTYRSDRLVERCHNGVGHE